MLPGALLMSFPLDFQDGCFLWLGMFSSRVSATPFSSHSSPERWLSREMPVVGQGDRSNDHPQSGGICVTTDQVGHYRRRWEEDEREGPKTGVHEHRYEQALGML